MEVGYEQTTVALIRSKSGVSNGALFHRFPSKEAIAAALYVEAIRSFQEEHWRMLDHPPATLREAVHAIVGHQLQWIQDHQDQAQFIYERGHLDWNEEASTELAQLNGRLVEAYRAWLAPHIASGEVRRLSTRVLAAIVAGPAHQIGQRWLEGNRAKPLTQYTDDLAYAAWAGVSTPEALRGEQAPARAAAPAQPRRVRVQLLGDHGEPLGEGELTLHPDAT